MKNNRFLIALITLVSTIGNAQDYLYKNQNMVLGSLNPSFYGFGDSSKTGIMYSTEGFNQNTKMENKFAFAHHYFEDNSFSMAMDINSLQISSLGYSISTANLHYIYRTELNQDWVFNPSISAGYGNTRLDYNELVFEDQINVLTGSIVGISNDPIKINNNVNYFDVGAGVSFYNTNDLLGNQTNVFFGANIKHINRPETSINTNVNNKKDLLLSVQSGMELDINKYNQSILPYHSYMYLYNSFTKQGNKSRFDLYQQFILGNVGFGLNEHINNYEGFTISQFGTSLNVFIDQIEIGTNYSFQFGGNKFAGAAYNTFEVYIIFDFNPFKKNRRGDYSRFFDMNN